MDKKPVMKGDSLEPNCTHLFTGMTPLHIACLRGDDPALIQKLLDKGIDPTLTDYDGKTAKEYLDLSYDEVMFTI